MHQLYLPAITLNHGSTHYDTTETHIAKVHAQTARQQKVITDTGE